MMPVDYQNDRLVYFFMFSLVLHGLILLAHYPEEKNTNERGLEIVLAGSKGQGPPPRMLAKDNDKVAINKHQERKQTRKRAFKRKHVPCSKKRVKAKRKSQKKRSPRPRPVEKTKKESVPEIKQSKAFHEGPRQKETVAATVAPKTHGGRDTARSTDRTSSLSGSEVKSASSHIKGRYLSLVRRIIEAHKFYPYNARVFGRQGKVKVSFSIDEKGNIELVEIVSKCPFRILNRAAIETLRASSPLPPPPSELKPPLRIKMDIVFKLDS